MQCFSALWLLLCSFSGTHPRWDDRSCTSSGSDLFPTALRMLGTASSHSFPHPSEEARSLILTQTRLGRNQFILGRTSYPDFLNHLQGPLLSGWARGKHNFFKPDMLKEFTPCSHSDQSRRLLRHHGHHLSPMWAPAEPEAVTTGLTISHCAPSENESLMHWNKRG